LEVLNTPDLISAFLTILYVAVVVSFIIGWERLSDFTRSTAMPKVSVSIIVAARNEAENISLTIMDLLAQDYDPSLMEIIFIDDHSTDATGSVISSFQDPRIRLITLNETNTINSYKKKAIQTAIATAKGKLIITTDADCRMGKNWLRTITDYYEQGGFKLISSPVAFTAEKSFFERAQSLEFLYLIGMGASTIGNKSPSTCNGANLAYEREAFYEVGGFQGIDDLASGDDELLLHKIAAKYKDKIGFLKHSDAIVYTQAKPTLGEFIQQRKRWASKSTRYKNKLIIVLGVLVWLFNLSIVLNLFAGLFNLVYLQVGLAQLLLKIIIEFAFLINVTRFAKRTKLLVLLPLLNVMHVVYIIYIGVAGNSGKYNWKGRMVK
jgi:cellulose synthase/poly-beta-1,6-N-acetylglucosamine synthase-like glycosyltransferase